jgi:hypothetical protein
VDVLNQLIRQTIISVWPDVTRRAQFRGINVEDMKSLLFNMGSTSVTAVLEEILEAGWPCWESADRLCALLTGETLSKNASQGIDVTDDESLRRAYAAMMQSRGYLLARINVIGEGVGHAYIFVSQLREKATSPLEGYLYQTNVGVRGHTFDLVNWVNDAKSKESVSLPGHLAQLQAQLIGKFQSSEGSEVAVPAQRGRVYDENYMLSTDPLPESHRTKIRDIGVTIRVSWRPIDLVEAFKRLRELPLNPPD